MHCNGHSCARVVDLVTECDSRKQVRAVVDLLDGEDHCMRQSQFTVVNAAHHDRKRTFTSVGINKKMHHNVNIIYTPEMKQSNIFFSAHSAAKWLRHGGVVVVHRHFVVVYGENPPDDKVSIL